MIKHTHAVPQEPVKAGRHTTRQVLYQCLILLGILSYPPRRRLGKGVIGCPGL